MSLENQIERGLAQLPSKVAIPLRKLYEAKQISYEILSSIILASELSNEPSKLLGFAIAFMHMQAQGVPVKDTIVMASNQRRRINLNWSTKRWKSEHDKLSRIETLARLTENSTKYDVSRFEQHLPKVFNGYLIRTSRRLGMEGLRQRHCVASYDNLLRSASSAIVTVFIDKQRWTVQLFLTGNNEAPLRIAQIRTRLNGLPSQKNVDEIHSVLKIRSKEYSPSTLATSRNHIENLRMILPTLREHAIQRIAVDFEGSSDHGCIGHIDYLVNGNLNGANQIPVEFIHSERIFQDGQWTTEAQRISGTLKEAIETITYDYLESTEVDWCSDEGGYGELVIRVPEETVSIEIYVRMTEVFCPLREEKHIYEDFNTENT